MAKVIYILSFLLCFHYGYSCDVYKPHVAVQTAYTAEIGVREASGKNDGKRVEQYLRSVGLGKGYSWCSAFVKFIFDGEGIKTTINAWSPTAHNSKNVVYEKGKFLKPWQTADVFTLYYPSLKRIGHTGFVDEVRGDNVVTVEGNTNAAGSREGDGVYRKIRPLKSIHSITRWL